MRTVGHAKQSGRPPYSPPSAGRLENISATWAVTRLRFCATINPTTAEIRGIAGDTLVSFVPMEAVGENGGLNLEKTRSLDHVVRGYTYFRDNDVVVAKITPCFENGKGSLANDLQNGIGFGTTELHVLRPFSHLDSKYLFYMTLSHAFRKIGASYMYGAGGQKRVPDDFVRDFCFAIPPPSWQRTIASYLDRETKRIDALLKKKQRQIELLQEKRTALISHAVTKGIDPNVKMKDSGVEWLGEIPVHWKVIKLKYLIEGNLTNGLFKKKEFFGSGTKLLNVFDVYREDFVVDHENLERVEVEMVEQQKYGVKVGDIFFVRSSLKLEGVGRSVCAVHVPEPTVFECHVVRARPVQKTINPTFLVHLLNSLPATNRFISLASLVTMATIDQDKIKSIEVPLPPRTEQDRIMELLGQDGERKKKLERKISHSIALLREYRTSLISAAVTGKIDVRKEAA